MFLIRDWSFPDDQAYGLQGGQQLLNTVMKVEDDQRPELKSLRQYIFGSFEKISCFLMPHPGRTVASKKDFDGRWSEIDKEFVDNLKDLTVSILSPENLSIKKINGQDLLVNEFYMHIDQYIQMFMSKELPEPQSIYEATVTNHMNILLAKSFMIYSEFFQNGFNNLTEIHEIDFLHKQAEQLSIQKYLKDKKMGTVDHEVAYKQKLENQINESFKQRKPLAIDYIKKIQESRRNIEKEAALKKEAEANADKANIKLVKATTDLQNANIEMERVKNESYEIRIEAKQIQMEAFKIQLESKFQVKDALRQAEEAHKREIQNINQMEHFKEQFRQQNINFDARLQSELIKFRKEYDANQPFMVKFAKWIFG